MARPKLPTSAPLAYRAARQFFQSGTATEDGTQHAYICDRAMGLIITCPVEQKALLPQMFKSAWIRRFMDGYPYHASAAYVSAFR